MAKIKDNIAAFHAAMDSIANPPPKKAIDKPEATDPIAHWQDTFTNPQSAIERELAVKSASATVTEHRKPEMIGQIIPVGAKGFPQRWMYVTGENDQIVCGQTWFAGRWSKGITTFGRAAVNCGTPKSPRPSPPQNTTPRRLDHV